MGKIERTTIVRVRALLPARVVLVAVQEMRPVVAVLRALQTARRGVLVRVQGALEAVQVGVLMRAREPVQEGVQRHALVAVLVAAHRVQDDRR